MHASELAAAAVQVLTGGAPVSAEQKSAVRELVWGRLGRSTLGASALARLHEQPGEGSASIVASVLADELRADPDFAELMSRVLRLRSNPPAQTATPQGAAAGPPPTFPPRVPAAAPAQTTPDAAEVWKIWLLGLPQMILAYVVISVATHNGAGRALQVVILLASASLAGYGVWRGIRLLRRRIRGHLLEAGMVLNVLVLIRLVLWLVGV
ncbi:hypothetical protein R1T08_34060 [Streptomyces sp. SBC-4]|nr:hypothetical protein [Streptomyces sp. SBC-4]MDV5149029.1 hypothetical protein [Streptomyces sp. SBC-4]